MARAISSVLFLAMVLLSLHQLFQTALTKVYIGEVIECKFTRDYDGDFVNLKIKFNNKIIDVGDQIDFVAKPVYYNCHRIIGENIEFYYSKLFWKRARPVHGTHHYLIDYLGQVIFQLIFGYLFYFFSYFNKNYPED